MKPKVEPTGVLTTTLADYIRENELGVDMKDTHAVKMVAAHLVALGYERRRVRENGVATMKWVKDNRAKRLAELQRKLDRLEGRA